MKEETYTLNTNEGTRSFTTNRITGELKALILKNEGKVDVKIMSELGYEIYEIKQHSGHDYIPVKISSVINPFSKLADKTNIVPDTLWLNERLLISLQGWKNTEVIIMLRYKEEKLK